MKKNTLTKKNKLFFLFTSGICSTLLLSSCNVLYNHVDGTVPINNIKSSDITIPLLVENVSNIKESELSSINENKNLNKAIYDEIRTVRPDIEYGDFAISENVEPGGPVPEYVFCKVSSAPKTVQKKIFGEYTKKVFLTPIVKKIDISVLTKSFTDSINIDINVANCKNVTDNELISLLNTNPAVINRVQIALNLLDTLPEMNDIMISNNFSSGDYSKYPTYEGSFSIQAKSSSQIYTGNFYFRTTITIYEVKKTISAVTLTQDISLTLHTTQPQSISWEEIDAAISRDNIIKSKITNMLINNYDIWKVTNSDFSVSFDDAHQTYNILNSTAIQVKVSAINGSRVIYGDFTCLKTASFKFLVIGLQERVSLNNLTINIFESTTDMRRHIFKYITTLLNPKNLTWSEVSNFVLTETDESSRIFSDDVQSWGIAPICQTATASDYIIELIPNTENDYSNVVEVKFVVTAKPTSNYLVGRTVLSSIFVQVERQA